MNSSASWRSFAGTGSSSLEVGPTSSPSQATGGGRARSSTDRLPVVKTASLAARVSGVIGALEVASEGRERSEHSLDGLEDTSDIGGISTGAAGTRGEFDCAR